MFIMRRMKKSLNKAIVAAGGITALARALDVSTQRVWNWLNRDGKAPAEYAVEIERITGVPCWEIRPDIFPPERFAKEAA